MLNPMNPVHRDRMVRALQFSYNELRKYTKMRDNTVRAYLGVSPHLADWGWEGPTSKYRQSLPKGNLLQMAGLNMQIALAYGEPQFRFTARIPEHKGFAEKLTLGVNRMATLLNLGETARAVAADSFFGYGIYKTGVGFLPRAAQQATGMEIGPCSWRVNQADFIYDLGPNKFDDCAFIGDIYKMPLNDAQRIYPGHEDQLAQLSDIDRLDSRHVLPRPSRFYTPELDVWLIDVYFPQSRVVATWPVRNITFGEVANEPICLRDYTGHWSGIYQVLSHLYSPDELVPAAQAESVKSLHFLFNDILHLTSEQALHAKYHPLYQAGADKDMRRIWDAADRRPVSVTDPSRFGSFEIPGPSQSQTSYMAALMQLFKQFTPTTDEPQRAPTATQGALERQSTNAVVAESRRKFNKALQMVGYKLGHLLIEDDSIALPAAKPVRPGSKVMGDMSWYPKSIEPRLASVDDFDIMVEPYPLMFRTPQERLQNVYTMTQQLANLAQIKAAGIPINFENALKTFAEFSGEPEVESWFEDADPLYQAKEQQGKLSIPRVGVGQYTRTSVSEKTTAGALEQNLNNAGSDNSTVRYDQ